jgi:hypothetical protein
MNAVVNRSAPEPPPIESITLTMTPTEFSDMLACAAIACNALKTKRQYEESVTVDRRGLYDSLKNVATDHGL